jgi:hypothetical protein
LVTDFCDTFSVILTYLLNVSSFKGILFSNKNEPTFNIHNIDESQNHTKLSIVLMGDMYVCVSVCVCACACVYST